MCKKNILTFLKFYCFVWCAIRHKPKKTFCSEEISSDNQYLKQGVYGWDVGFASILVGLAFVIGDYAFEEESLTKIALLSLFIVFVYSILQTMYVWFFKLNDVFEREHEEEKHR